MPDILAASTPADAIEIVDAHHHLWDLRQGHYPWLQEEYNPQRFFLGAYRPLCQNFLPCDYRAASQGCRIMATVHVEAERDRTQQLAETIWLHEQHARHGLPHAVVAHVWLDRPDSGQQLLEQLRYPLVKGIRCKPLVSAQPGAPQHRPGAAGSMLHPDWLHGLSLLQQLGLSWDLRVPSWHLQEAAEVAAQLPQLAIVLNHHGLAWDRSPQGLQSWRRGMEILARHSNVHVKLSEFGLRKQPWDSAANAALVREVIALFGWQRCMFASNFPVAGLRISFAGLVAWMQQALADLSAQQQRAVMSQNALRFYRITPETLT